VDVASVRNCEGAESKKRFDRETLGRRREEKFVRTSFLNRVWFLFVLLFPNAVVALVRPSPTSSTPLDRSWSHAYCCYLTALALTVERTRPPAASSLFFSGRRRPRREALERGREEDRAVPRVQPLGLFVGERREKPRLRRPDRVHETVRTEIRRPSAAADGGRGRERRTHRLRGHRRQGVKSGRRRRVRVNRHAIWRTRNKSRCFAAVRSIIPVNVTERLINI